MSVFEEEIIRATKAIKIKRIESIQNLWSGYGEIRKYHLSGGKYPSIIVKHICWPEDKLHPKGWNTDRAHQRKLTSYQVESNWYQDFAALTNAQCPVPQLYHIIEQDGETLLLMEDLDAIGYSIRKLPGTVSLTQVKSCLAWLANFHALFMGAEGAGLWPIGTYWHLGTRPEEWQKMEHTALKEVAGSIDEYLNKATFQTLVHGDAKLANFCFSEKGQVAVVDFQYVGKGCGMKDVAYLISSCFDSEACEKYEKELLQHYFSVLENAIGRTADYPSLKAEWSDMYAYAWADFYRFLDGWSPGHWKMHRYSRQITQQVIHQLKHETN